MTRPFLMAPAPAAIAATAATMLALAGGARPARADGSPVANYALVVGSNPGGPGQAELHYAESDARRVASVLGELGGYEPALVDVLLHPSPGELREHLDRITTRIAASTAAGQQARLFFYYSGHARATALDLGSAELPLDELRTRLSAGGATLTVVVLDACQSGAYSRVKGAKPAADFSFNSRNQLAATGTAVLASSTGSELSQESEQLKGSYFTHSLVVGLSGAGDTNRDGTVSLDEAYRYAYHQTLLATAVTAVGGQHVSLEVDLVGHGEVALSFPRAATAAITLPAALAGEALVEDTRAKAVVAELHKAAGAPIRIAVAPGAYEVIVRDTTTARRCPITVAPGETMLDLERCTSEPLVATRAKGLQARRHQHILDFGLALGNERRDAYTQTLENFGYDQDFVSVVPAVHATWLTRGSEHLWFGGTVSYESLPTWSLDTERAPLRVGTRAMAARAVARGRVVLHAGRRIETAAYADIAAGLGLGITTFHDQDGNGNRSYDLGLALAGTVGLEASDPFAPGLHIFVEGGVEGARLVENDLGDVHDLGGLRFGAGLGYHY